MAKHRGTKGMHCTRFKHTKGGKRCAKFSKGSKKK